MKLVVLDGHCLNPGDLSWDALKKLVDVEVYDRTTASEVVVRAGDAELVMTNKTLIDAASLERLTRLKYIGVLATGFNIVDVDAARGRGIVVTNIPTYGTASVAQHAFALLLELCHHVGLHGEAVRDEEWSRSADWSFWKMPLVELAGKTMGGIGFGRIGRQTARIADAMGMRVIANDAIETAPPPYEGFRWVEVNELLAESDVVSLHCPLTADNKGLINAGRLRRMKKTAFLINTSRGPLVVDQDLAGALNAGVIAGAGLDVLSVEPPASGNPLFSTKNCIVTPHIAWATKEARARLMEVAVRNVASFLEGRAENVVG
ncbi:MAG: D-2-hydroxyacid dehydrogenase [Acidobacteria bacterium]|nr:D-2-hydroxyacid dehydrogenase [Acidobacteriota bacterium]